MQDCALQGRKQSLHEIVAIRQTCFSQSTANVTNETTAVGQRGCGKEPSQASANEQSRPVLSQCISKREQRADEEGSAEDITSDEDRVEEFPELVVQSDSDEDTSVDEELDEDEYEEEDSNFQSNDPHYIFPKPKTVVSAITKQPKLVYPGIEPEYDSDSSTEEVSDDFKVSIYCSNNGTGTQPCR